MAQRIKVFASQPDDLSLLPGIHMVERETASFKFFSDFQMHSS